MKALKIIGIALFVIISVLLIVALFAPKDYKSEREIVINKPKTEVWNYIKYLRNQESFGVWYRMDSAMTKKYEGTDGTVGFTYTWESKKVGNGKQTVTNIIEGEKIESQLDFGFGEPANAYLSVEEKSAGETLVKWGIGGKSPYPLNLFNLFFDAGQDFEQGLQNLQEILETQKTTAMEFQININASAEKVYNTMLGIDNIKTYEEWTAVFCPNPSSASTYEGDWAKGSKIRFGGTDENGNKGGMLSEVAENVPNKYVSLRHYGLLQGDQEITTGEEVEKWAGSTENYGFEETNGVTTVTVTLTGLADTEFVSFFNDVYPKALEKLKEITEKN